METEEHDISAICINLVNVVDAFTNLKVDFIFFIRNYCKKKRYTKNIAFVEKCQIQRC